MISLHQVDAYNSEIKGQSQEFGKCQGRRRGSHCHVLHLLPVHVQNLLQRTRAAPVAKCSTSCLRELSLE